jgi:hypothetical protein
LIDWTRYTADDVNRIVNPLSEKTEAELMADVETFCSTHGFSDEIDLFKKGALVAQNPASFEDLPMLTEDDRYWLRREITNRWDQPKMLYFTIGVLSLGSAVQGWDNTGVNGANLVSKFLQKTNQNARIEPKNGL